MYIHTNEMGDGQYTAVMGGMERWKGRVVLVTGAAASMGSVVARELVYQGMVVIGCDKDLLGLHAIKDDLDNKDLPVGEFHPVQCDLTQEEDILAMFETVKRDFGRLDVCVNVTSSAQNAPLLSGGTWQWRHMIDMNLIAHCICTREAVKMMRETDVKDGHVIFVNSLTGHQVLPDPRWHFYCASKHALRAIVEGVRNELREQDSKIRVSSISPGLVQTSLTAPDTSGITPLRPKDVANCIQYALGAPQHMQVDDIIVRPTDQIF